MNRAKGFTLIELMIAVAIIGILAAIAYPSYREHVRETRRGDCEGALQGLANAMERYFTTRNTYVGATIGNNPGDIYPAQCPVGGGTATYNLAIVNPTATTYSLTAAPTGPQAGDDCGTLTLDNVGQTGAGAQNGKTAQSCWGRL